MSIMVLSGSAPLWIAGLTSIAERGIRTGMLYVDRDNTSAVSLYRRLGFVVHRTDRAYVGDIRPTEPDHTPETES